MFLPFPSDIIKYMLHIKHLHTNKAVEITTNFFRFDLKRYNNSLHTAKTRRRRRFEMNEQGTKNTMNSCTREGSFFWGNRIGKRFRLLLLEVNVKYHPVARSLLQSNIQTVTVFSQFFVFLL